MVLDAPKVEDQTLKDRANINKVLVVAPNWLGDAVLAGGSSPLRASQYWVFPISVNYLRKARMQIRD